MSTKVTTTRIYLDNASATAVDSRVRDAMAPYWSERFGNPDAIHREGVRAKEALEHARTQVSNVVRVQSEGVVFTSGGTEANNLALFGAVEARAKSGVPYADQQVLVSAIEHASVLRCAESLAARGVRVDILPVDNEGFVDLTALRAVLSPQTTLVSVLYAHNEIGTIARIPLIAREVRKVRGTHGTYPLLHTDASQAPAWLPCHLPTLGADLLTLDAQKMYGPKGVGALVRTVYAPLAPFCGGGAHEWGLRPGTPPVSLIVGMAHALSLVEGERSEYVPSISILRDYCIETVLARVPLAVLQGAKGVDRLPHHVHFSFPHLDGERIVLEMDARGIAISTRSACNHSEESGSSVVRTLTNNESLAKGAIRLSMSRHTSKEEIEYVVHTLIEVVQLLYRETGIDRNDMIYCISNK